MNNVEVINRSHNNVINTGITPNIIKLSENTLGKTQKFYNGNISSNLVNSSLVGKAEDNSVTMSLKVEGQKPIKLSSTNALVKSFGISGANVNITNNLKNDPFAAHGLFPYNKKNMIDVSKDLEVPAQELTTQLETPVVLPTPEFTPVNAEKIVEAQNEINKEEFIPINLETPIKSEREGIIIAPRREPLYAPVIEKEIESVVIEEKPVTFEKQVETFTAATATAVPVLNSDLEAIRSELATIAAQSKKLKEDAAVKAAEAKRVEEERQRELAEFKRTEEAKRKQDLERERTKQALLNFLSKEKEKIEKAKLEVKANEEKIKLEQEKAEKLREQTLEVTQAIKFSDSELAEMRSMLSGTDEAVPTTNRYSFEQPSAEVTSDTGIKRAV